LIAAVVALAIKDACKGGGSKQLPRNTESALRFLFLHSDAYLALLDIDPQQFRIRLLAYVENRKTTLTLPHNLSEFERRGFALNYRQWQSQGFHAPLDYEDNEEDICES
jgi:hypothetical protein